MDINYCEIVDNKMKKKSKKKNYNKLSVMFETNKTKKCPKGKKICNCKKRKKKRY